MSDRRTRNAPVLSNRRDYQMDRRNAPRYATRGTAAVVGWTEGPENTPQTIQATLLDISLGGFAAAVETFPPQGVPVWLRLDGETPSPWIKASVIETITSGFLWWSRRRIRLRFHEVCPYEFFKAAIDGFSHEFKATDTEPEEVQDHLWQ